MKKALGWFLICLPPLTILSIVGVATGLGGLLFAVVIMVVIVACPIIGLHLMLD